MYLIRIEFYHFRLSRNKNTKNKNSKLLQTPWISSPKESVFPETIPEEASSIEEERVVIFRLPYSTGKPSLYMADASLLQQSQENMLSKLADGDRFNFDKIQRFTVNQNRNGGKY